MEVLPHKVFLTKKTASPIQISKKVSSASYIINVMTTPPNGTDPEKFWKLESMVIPEDETKTLLSTSGIPDTNKENSITYSGSYESVVC